MGVLMPTQRLQKTLSGKIYRIKEGDIFKLFGCIGEEAEVVVAHPGKTYNLQNHFEMEGVLFSIKISPLGANLCLLEELEDGFIAEMIGDSCSCWKRWFHTIRTWQKTDVDNDRLMWVRIHGVPCQTWCVYNKYYIFFLFVIIRYFLFKTIKLNPLTIF